MIQLNRVIAGDCLKVMRDIPDESVHLAVTSPPYNISIDYDTYDDSGTFGLRRSAFWSKVGASHSTLPLRVSKISGPFIMTWLRS